MEEILIKQKKWKNIAVEIRLTEMLDRLNKGSYNRAIESLLNANPDKAIKERVRQLEEDMLKMQELIERLCVFNKLKA